MARRLLLILLVIVIVVVVAAGGLLAWVVWRPDTLKGPIERYASAKLGRKVTITGPLALDPGRITTVDARGIAVAAPDWAASPELATIRHLHLGLDLGAYWRDRAIVITELRLDQPRLALERDAQGRTTWPSGTGGATSQDQTATTPASTDGTSASTGTANANPGLPRVEALTIEDGRIDYRDAVTDVALQAAVATIPPQPGAAHDFGGLKLDGKGTVRGGDASVTFAIGSPLLLTQAGTPFPIKGQLTLAGTRLTLDGQARDPLTLQGLDLALDLASQDPSKLLALFGQPAAGPVPPNLTLKGHLTRQGTAFELADLQAGWDQSQAQGHLAYDPAAKRPALTGELQSRLLDLAALAPAFTGGKGGGTTGVPQALVANDARLQLAAARVRLPRLELRDVALGLVLAGGHLTLDPLRGSLPQGRLDGRLETADLTQQPLATAVTLQAQDLGLGQAQVLLPPAPKLAGRLTGTLAGTARGLDTTTLLAKSDLVLKGVLDGLQYGKVAAQKAQLEAKLADGKLTLDPLAVTVGEGSLGGRMALAGLGQDQLATTLDLKAQHFALDPITAFVPAAKDLAGRFTGTLNGTVRGTEPATILARSALTLAGEFEALRYGDYTASAAALTAKLTDAKLTLDPLDLTLPQGRLRGKLATGPLDQPFAGDLDLVAEAIELAPLLSHGTTSAVGGTLSGTLKGTVRGASPAAILAQSQLTFAGTLDKPRLPQVGDRLGPVGLSATLQPKGERPLAITATSTLNGAPFRLDFQGRDPDVLLAGKGALPVSLQASLGDTKATADGKLTLPLAEGRLDAALTLAGPNPGPVLALFNAPAIELPPYRLAGNLTRRGPSYTLDGLDGRVGDSDIAGKLALRLDGPRPAVSGGLHSRLLDLNDLGGLVGAEPGTGPGETASAGQQAKAAAKKQDQQVLPEDQLNPARWRQLDVAIELTADKVKAGRIPLDGFELKTVLQDGLLRVDPLTLKLGEGETTGWLQLDARKAPAAASLDIDMRRLPVARLLSRLQINTGDYGTLSGRARGGASLSGQGLSTAQLLGTADGQVTLLMQGGTLNRQLVTALGFDFLRLFGAFLGAAPEQVQIGCALADLTVKDGLVHTRSLAIETPVANIGGEGEINLKNEQIDLTLIADPKGVAVPGGRTGITITGTLANPQIAVNPARLLARGLAAATFGVFLSPLTELASQLGLGQGSKGPCSSLLDKTSGQGGDQGGGAPGP